MAFTLPPPGLATMPMLVGLRAISAEVAAANRARLRGFERLAPAEKRSASLNVGPTQPRAALPALCPGLAPRALLAAVDCGDLPKPTRGPWGEAWPVAAVVTWAATRRS